MSGEDSIKLSPNLSHTQHTYSFNGPMLGWKSVSPDRAGRDGNRDSLCCFRDLGGDSTGEITSSLTLVNNAQTGRLHDRLLLAHTSLGCLGFSGAC